MKKNPLFVLFLIVLVAIIAAFFVYPKNFGANVMPWRLGLDLIGGSHLVYNVDLSKVSGSDQDSVLNGLRDVIERRVNLFGVSEPQVFVAKSGNDSNLVVELAGIKDTAQAIQQIGETPLLDFREVEQNSTITEFIQTNLTGRYITSAQLTFNPNTQAQQVSISFNDEGGKIFEMMTEKNVGKPLAIFLDGSLVEMPTVQEKISGGQAVITGRFTLNDAKTLVERFNAGALPAPITLISQQTISPTLGFDSLKKTIVAGIIGTLLVIAFMLAYYRLFGVFATVALLIYVFTKRVPI